MKTNPSPGGFVSTLKLRYACCLSLASVLAGTCFAQGPYAPTNWPPIIDTNKTVHFGVVDNAFASPGGNWTNTLDFVLGGDQATVLAGCLKGFTGRKGTTTYLNFKDTNWMFWSNVEVIDVLMQVYGDAGLLYGGTDQTRTRVLRFQEGSSSPRTVTPGGYATNAYNFRWNWILWSITNFYFTNSVDGQLYRLVGNLKPGNTSPFGGVNGGTIRLVSADNSFSGFTVHAIAFGESGAFGTTNDVNLFDTPDITPCAPVPSNNLVGIDFNAGIYDHMTVVSNVDAVLEAQTGIGPGDDQRNAVIPTAPNGGGGYLYNFGILDNYLGLPCNANAIFKICVDFYDDPSFANDYPLVQFGPEAFATDGLGCSVMVYPNSGLYTLTGSGKWIRKSWIISNVNLYGVNTAPLTAGPRLISKFRQVPISRVQMGILRTGNDPLAGQDPLSDCALDPAVCEGAYTNFVEIDVANGTASGLDYGTDNTEQGHSLEMAGPPEDQRMSVFPTISPNYYLQFPIVNGALGPNYQDNAHLTIAVTYYDDPALAGTHFGIDAWHYSRYGSDTIFAASPDKWIQLEGTGKWREAYWEIDRITFNGVNQAPQAAARFKCEGPVHVSHVRYSVVRTCGPNTGVNWLDEYRVKSLTVGPDTNGLLRLSWPYQEPQLTVESALGIPGTWNTFMPVPILPEAEQAVVRVSPTNSVELFRLFRPSIP